MALQTPLVLISGAFSTLPPGDTIPATDAVAQASGNAALVLAGTALASGNAGISTGLTALASGNAGISTGLTALASGNAGISTGLTALASGNAGLVSASNKVPISGGTMTGVLAVTSGTAALPGITFTGDTNTGLFSPGADQVAISTGGTSRLSIDASGNLAVDTNTLYVDAVNDRVAIGTTSPLAALHIASNSNEKLIIQSINNSANEQQQISFYNAAVLNASISAGKDGANASIGLAFHVGGAERMGLDSSGNLKFNSGYGSAATAYGCRAWVNFNGTGTVAIRASGNVSSITDNGTGDYTVNFTTALVDANYAVTGLGGKTSESPALSGVTLGVMTLAAGSFRFQIRAANNPDDLQQVFIAIFR